MAVARLTCTFAKDSLLARDKLTITPHFQIAGAFDTFGVGWKGLTDDLSTALATWQGNTCEVTVTAYDAESPPPNFPEAITTRNKGLAPASTIPREVALCLSFYGERNVPKQRGRLFLPMCLTSSSVGLRPSTPNMQKVADLVPIFAGLGGIDVDWVVWSRRDRAAHKVQNWWVDDEFDTQRSRGLRATTRLAGTTSG